MMSFSVRASAGAARTGIISLPGRGIELQTPALLINTRRGQPIHLTPDVLETLKPEAAALQICTLHFLESPGYGHVAEYGRGLHEFLGMQPYGLFAIARDSLMVTPGKYMAVINALRPDLYAALPDEVPPSASLKRERTSVDRTLHWLDACLSLATPETGGKMFGVVVGGASKEERRRSAEETALRDVAGFQLAGFGLGESAEERQHLLTACIGVSAGIDLFESLYPHHLTIGGLALTFPLNSRAAESAAGRGASSRGTLHGGQVAGCGAADVGASSMTINMRALSYRESKAPLLEGCQCYACRCHSRAYIHHLLNTHEMLAEVLLNIHNTHHYLQFFKEIRGAIAQGTFEDYRKWFVTSRQQEAALL
eukprot:jgi/Mesen1/1235/ME000129S00329